MDKETFEALRRVVINFAPSEGKHYAELEKPEDHIFRDLLKLAAHVDLVVSEK